MKTNFTRVHFTLISEPKTSSSDVGRESTPGLLENLQSINTTKMSEFISLNEKKKKKKEASESLAIYVVNEVS